MIKKEEIKEKIETRGWTRLGILISLLILVSWNVIAEINIGYDDIEGKSVVVIDVPEEGINYSLVNVNNSLYWNGYAWSDYRWLLIDGSNANTNININNYNLTAGYIIADGSHLYNVNFTGYYPHDQDLNTTDSVSFYKVNASNYTGTYLNVTNGTFKYLNVTENLYVKNSTIYLGNVSMSSFVDGNGKKIITFGDTFVNASGYFGDGGFLDNISFVNGTVIAIAFNGSEFTGGNFTGDNFTVNGYLTLNNTTISDFSELYPHDQSLNTTDNVTFNTVNASLFHGVYDFIAELPWLVFNGTYLFFNETFYNITTKKLINQVLDNYTFTNLTVENLNVTGGLTLDNETIYNWSTFEVKEYTEVVLVNVSGGSGSNQTSGVVEFEVKKIEVVPSSSSARYWFEAKEEVSGEYIDKSFRRHWGNWTTYPDKAVNEKINVSVTGASVDGIYTVTIKYLDNYRY